MKKAIRNLAAAVVLAVASAFPNIAHAQENPRKTDKTKKDLNKLKLFITKKYPFIQAIGLLPPRTRLPPMT